LPDPAVRNIFREIIFLPGSRPPISAFLGPEASFTHQAALAHFGREASFAETGDCRYFQRGGTRSPSLGVVPIETPWKVPSGRLKAN
jgi:chorismate mutase/prephenate dehydratase